MAKAQFRLFLFPKMQKYPSMEENGLRCQFTMRVLRDLSQNCESNDKIMRLGRPVINLINFILWVKLFQNLAQPISIWERLIFFLILFSN